MTKSFQMFRINMFQCKTFEQLCTTCPGLKADWLKLERTTSTMFIPFSTVAINKILHIDEHRKPCLFCFLWRPGVWSRYYCWLLFGSLGVTIEAVGSYTAVATREAFNTLWATLLDPPGFWLWCGNISIPGKVPQPLSASNYCQLENNWFFDHLLVLKRLQTR